MDPGDCGGGRGTEEECRWTGESGSREAKGEVEEVGGNPRG